MRRLIVLGVACILLVQVPGWATATEVVVNDALHTFMQGTLNACAWAGTRAHKLAGTTWQSNNNPAITCTTNGTAKAVSNPPDAIATHTIPKDQVHASADAQCQPGCATFTIHNSVTVVNKPHSVAAGSYGRGGTGQNLVEPAPGIALKGPLTVSFSGKMDLSSGTDPYESVIALAITDQALNEGNSELIKLLDIAEPPHLMCMAPSEDPAGAKKHCGDHEKPQKIVFQDPHTTYFMLLLYLDMNGQLHVKTHETAQAKLDKSISIDDFVVTSVDCVPLEPHKKPQQCFTADIKGKKLTRIIELGPIYPKENPRPLAIDVINGIVARPPFE